MALVVEDLREYLAIDKDQLDEALVTQSDIFYRISEAFSDAVSIRDEAHENVKTVDADINLAIREQAADDGRKITEALVLSTVLDSKDHKAAVAHYLKSKRESEEWGNLREAFNQRAHALRELVQLYVAGYYVLSSVSGASNQASEHIDEKYLAARNRNR